MENPDKVIPLSHRPTEIEVGHYADAVEADFSMQVIQNELLAVTD